MASFLDSVLGSSGIPSSPTSQLISTSSISPWAQPYVSSYLQRAQNLSTSAPSAFQNQVASSAQNMGMPEQFGMGTNLANQGGQGALSTAPMALNYGQMGAGIGSQGIGIGAQGMNYGMNAGSNYANQATNPYAVGAYMNPYLQQSLAPQLSLLNQQQALGAQDIAGKATGQGAFGGNRATLAQGLNNQNYALAKQQAIGQGYNEAFKNAQQAQQFGSTLGLQGAMQGTSAGLAGLDTGMRGAGLGLQGVQGAQQGYQGATQAGAALGNIGAQQGQYELAKMALQNQIANQQYKQPFENVQFMQSMMGGLPVSASTQQGYQAPPNYLSQIAGLGFTGLGMYGMGKDLGWWGKGGGAAAGGGGGAGFDLVSGGGNYGFGSDALNASGSDLSSFYGATGGLPKDFKKSKGYAEGGTVNYRAGGDVDLIPTQNLSPMLRNPNVDPMQIAAIEKELLDRARIQNNPQSRQILGGGLDTIPSGDMFRAAGGGIVAFAGNTDGSFVQSKSNDDYLSQYTDKKGNVDLNKAALSLLGQARPAAETDSVARQELLQDIKDSKESRANQYFTRLGLGMLSGTSPYMSPNVGNAGIDLLNTYSKDVASERALKRELAKLDAEGAAKDDARRLQLAGTLLQIQGNKDAKSIAMANAPSGEERAILKVQAMINQDDQIPQLIKQRDMETPGTPRYNAYNDAINSIKQSYFQQVGIKRPFVAPANVQFPAEPEKKGFFSSLFGSSKPEAPAQNKVVPFSQLPS